MKLSENVVLPKSHTPSAKSVSKAGTLSICWFSYYWFNSNSITSRWDVPNIACFIFLTFLCFPDAVKKNSLFTVTNKIAIEKPLKEFFTQAQNRIKNRELAKTYKEIKEKMEQVQQSYDSEKQDRYYLTNWCKSVNQRNISKTPRIYWEKSFSFCLW